MQSKLSEILELCIEKGNRNKFYYFEYDTQRNYLIIRKYEMIDGRKIQVVGRGYSSERINFALEYMQNE